jgi:hypothetical protein
MTLSDRFSSELGNLAMFYCLMSASAGQSTVSLIFYTLGHKAKRQSVVDIVLLITKLTAVKLYDNKYKNES